ncbi:MAG TPA: glycine zipper 2TM domain-containing protein [Oxalicibacterium sp.]|nr:glycine zipper 2TM domain-containing protein [Oxalicibacterium sp.]
MKTFRQLTLGSAVCVAALGLSACSGMSAQEKNTLIGTGTGAVAGSVLTGGSTLGTVGGAAVGGYIGNQVVKPHDK